jgi:hypothetical protein
MQPTTPVVRESDGIEFLATAPPTLTLAADGTTFTATATGPDGSPARLDNDRRYPPRNCHRLRWNERRDGGAAGGDGVQSLREKRKCMSLPRATGSSELHLTSPPK